MVADSLPSFKDDNSFLKRFQKRNTGKKNKFKEKSNKQDINVASKYRSQDGNPQKLLRHGSHFVSCNSDVDNKKMEENQNEQVDCEYQYDKEASCKKRRDEIINILKNPQIERRSVKLKVKDMSVIDSKKEAKSSKICIKEEFVNQTNTKEWNDRQNMIKKCLSETSVKQYLQVAIEHEDTVEKQDPSKDEDISQDDIYKSLNLAKPFMKTEESLKNNKKMVNWSKGSQNFCTDIKDKDLINTYKQLERRGIFDRRPDELTSLMETTLENVKEGLNKLMQNCFYDSQMEGHGQGREFKEKSMLQNKEKDNETEGTDFDHGKMNIQKDEMQSIDQVQIPDGKTEKDQDTLENKLATKTDQTNEHWNRNVDGGHDKVEPMMYLKILQTEFNPYSVIENVETLKCEVEIQLRTQLTDFQNFERILKNLQRTLTRAVSVENYSHFCPDKKFTDFTEFYCAKLPSIYGFDPECEKKSGVSPLEKFNFSMRSHSSKGDNHGNQNNPGNQNSSSGSRQTGNSNKGNSGGNDKESSRKHEEEKDRDEQEELFGPPDNDNVDGFPENNSQNSNPTVLPNYKFRRKHGKLEDGSLQLMEIFGKLKDINENIPPDILEQLNLCLLLCLASTKFEATQECSICVCLSSLISHFGGCGCDYLQCTECIPIFSLIIQHVTGCISKTQAENESCTILCRKISIVVSFSVEILKKKSSQLWTKLKKYMARYQLSISSVSGQFDVDSDDLFSMSSLGSLSSIRSLTSEVTGTKPPRVQRPSTSYLPSLGIIPEKGGNFVIESKPKPVGRGRIYSQSRSEPLCRKLSDGTIQWLKKDSRSAVSAQPQPLICEDQLRSVGALGRTGHRSHSEVLYTRKINEISTITEERKTSYVRKISLEQVEQKTSEDEVDQKAAVTEEENEEWDDDKSWEGVYGENIMSLPPGFQIPFRQGISDQLLSLVESPTGVPGIGEVVYGTRQHFLKVIRHWTELKQEYGQKKVLPPHLREEGVILEEAKNAKKLKIFGTRYQKNFQWIRMTHLGSGMSGKCHLCMDHNTEFKFCIKKLHISKYEERELDIWSELKHEHVVRLLGAIRYGEKIYIMQDFVDGGCLTETINTHKQTRRRLSHWTALCYFKQILKALKYFRSKGIIHEDLKADNILLIQNTKKLVISDFGVSQRINKESSLRGASPLGTPTQLSPEKAQSKGHGFKSDVWSAVCVLVHMLSGNPPWVKRYPNAKMLNYIIVQHSPPLQDVPSNVSLDVQDLIRFGFTVNPLERPSAEMLLQHRAFKLLDDYDPETFSSMLLTSTREIPGTVLTEESGNSNDDDYEVLEQVQKDLKNNPEEVISKLEPGVGIQGQSSIVIHNSHAVSLGSSSAQRQNSLGHGILQVGSSFGISSQPHNLVDPSSSQIESSGEPINSQIQNQFSPNISQISFSIRGLPLENPDGPPNSQMKNKSRRLTDMLESNKNNSEPDTVEGACYISKEELERLGVCMPPDFETLIQNDPTDYYSKYLTDDKMENYLEQNAKYKNFLKPYNHEHKKPTKQECFPDDLDIDKFLLKHSKPSDLPDFEFLLSGDKTFDEESSSSPIPDIYTQLNTQAIESMMNQSGSSSNIGDDFKRSGSHKEESLKLDEELDALRQQLPEPLDLLDHQSLVKILNQPFTEMGRTKSQNSNLSGESMNSATNSKSDIERTPSDSTPVPTFSELPSNHRSEKKSTFVNSGPSTLPFQGALLSESKGLDHGPTTLPPVFDATVIKQFSMFNTEINESFKSDELFGSASEMFSPSTVQHIDNKIMKNEDFEETYPTPTFPPAKISVSKAKQDDVEEERVKTTEFDYEEFALGAISDFSMNQNKKHLSVSNTSGSMTLQKHDNRNGDSERKSSQNTLRLELSPNTKRKQFKIGANLSNPELSSYSSSPITAQPFSTPQIPLLACDFLTPKRDTGLGTSLPYLIPERGGYNARRESESSGVVTSPPFHDPDQEIHGHFMDVVESLSQSSHDKSHYHWESFDQDETNLDKSPSSWMLGSTEEEESLYVHETYLDHTSTGGTRITVKKPDGEKCVSLNLTNEHKNRSWKDIIEADLAQQIHMKGFRKFSLNDVMGKPIDLNSIPLGENITVFIVEPTEQHWYSEDNVIFDLGHF